MNGLGGFDYLLGGDGADTLTGGFGWDLLTGGAGADRFVYETGGQGGTGEVITDFQVGIDKIAFVTASTGITGLTLGQNLFIQNSNVTTITGSQGTGPGPTLIYDTSNGGLWYDANGNTAAGLIYLVGLSGTPVLTAGDFIVV
jgi:Ca2+-binding RTX toxin-like protein